jgi:cob(I)alamin adenosyltransferase
MHVEQNPNIIFSMARIFSGTGDDGYTGLLGEARVPKYHPKPVAYGTVDEASAVLGMARSMTNSDEVASITREIQHDLHAVMAELAATPDHREKFQRVDHGRVKWLEEQITLFSQTIQISKEFVIFGDSKVGAAFNLGRTVVRRAERAVAKLHIEGEIEYTFILQYLNRLSSLCFVLSLWEAQRGK